LLDKAREVMTEIGFRKVLLLAVGFAAVVVVLSTTGPGLGVLLFTLLPLAALFIVLYFIVRWAVAAGLRDARRRRHPNGAGGPRRQVRAG